ncbi:hypothetical protein JCM10207_000220 [Rhodosporidiobolus poonsookiae]
MASAASVTAQLPTSDRLSTLPVEILTEIFQLAYTDTSPSKGPISRALLPFNRAQRFRRIGVDSPEKLKALAKVIETGNVGVWVMELEMKQVEAADDTLPLKDRQLRAFFASLPRLTHLKLNEGCSALLNLILSQTLARNSLPSLTHLTFIAPTEWKNPFEPTQFSLLASYPSLRNLHIKSTKDFDKMTRVRPLVKKFQLLPLIQSLTLEGGDGVDLHKFVKRLIDACPALDRLNLFDSSADPVYAPLLPHLPEQLTSLSLRTRAFYDEYSAPCDALFPRFPNLEHLYLGEGTFSPFILNNLRPLTRLKTLGFGLGAILHTTELSRLFDASSPLSSLRTLVLDSVEGKTGWQVLFDGYGDLHPEAKAPDYLGPGWTLPRFSDEDDGPFTVGSVEKLLDKAKQPGIKVKIEGTTPAAYNTEIDFMIELTDCELAKAMETGDFHELETRYGFDFVHDRLEELGWYDGMDEWLMGL